MTLAAGPLAIKWSRRREEGIERKEENVKHNWRSTSTVEWEKRRGRRRCEGSKIRKELLRRRRAVVMR